MVALLLLAGIGIILQNEAAYRDLQAQETRVQAEILVGQRRRGARFRRRRRPRSEAVDAIRVNRQVRSVGVYDADGTLVAGYGRDGAGPPAPHRRSAARRRQRRRPRRCR